MNTHFRKFTINNLKRFIPYFENTNNYEKAKMNMYLALDEVVKYAQSRKISIAIETEGSLNKKNHLLMQRPDEYEEFMAKYSSSDIGMNLNIGHLNLAAKAFQFEREDFVDLIKDYIVAMELSHNDGLKINIYLYGQMLGIGK